jgi:hypothetical protein
MDPRELKELIFASKTIFKASGGQKVPLKEEKKNYSICICISCFYERNKCRRASFQRKYLCQKTRGRRF